VLNTKSKLVLSYGKCSAKPTLKLNRMSLAIARATSAIRGAASIPRKT
jgi:hypothetical protein